MQEPDASVLGPWALLDLGHGRVLVLEDGPPKPTGDGGRSMVTTGRERGCWAEGGGGKSIDHSTCLNLVLESQNGAWHCTKL